MKTTQNTQQAVLAHVRLHVAVLVVMSVLAALAPYRIVQAASSWSPTLIVNTESFQQIDAGDSTTDVDLRFGSSTSTLTLLTTGNFRFNKSLSVAGGISGSYLTVDRQANISGSLVVKQNATVRGNLSGSSFFGAGLGDCNNSTTSKLIYNPTTGKFSCATDQTGGGSSGGLGFTDASGIFVNQSGDTMTGALNISTSLTHTETGSLNILQRTHATGAYIKSTTNKEPALAIDIVGTSNAPHLLFGYQGVFDSNLYRAAANLLKTDDSFFAVGTISGSKLRVTGNADVHGILSASGAVHFDQNLSINDDRSAADAVLTFGNATLNQDLKFLHTEQRFQFSANLNVLGSISGKTLAVSGASSFSGAALFRTSVTAKGALSGTTFFGAGLGDCNNSTTSKLIYNATTGKFNCATDQTGGSSGGGGGWTDDGSVVRLDTAGDQVGVGTTAVQSGVKMEVIGTLSGSVVHASDRLSSSGTMVLKAPSAERPTFFANGGQMVGINTASPHSSLTASGTFATSIRIATTTGSINGNDQIIFASGASMITLTLPSASGIAGRQYTVKKINSSSNGHVRPVILAPNGSERIDGLVQWRLLNRGQQVTVISDGTNWQVMDASSYGINGYKAMGATMNQWYGSMTTATAHTTAVFTTTATMRTYPLIVEKVTTINGMSVSVSTTAASAQVALGLYNDSGRAYPNQLVVDAGTVATTTTGHRTICNSGCTTTGNSAFPITLQPGLYWLAINNNSIVHTLRGYALASFIPVTGKPNGYTTTTVVGWQISSTFGAFPASFPTNATATTAIPLPAITVRYQD